MIDKILGALLGFGVASAVSSKKYAKGGKVGKKFIVKDKNDRHFNEIGVADYGVEKDLDDEGFVTLSFDKGISTYSIGDVQEIFAKGGSTYSKGGQVKRFIVHKNEAYDGEIVGSSDTFRGANMIMKRLEKKGAFQDVNTYGIKDTEDYFFQRKSFAKGGKVDSFIDNLKKGDTFTMKFGSSISKDNQVQLQVRSRTKVKKGTVDKITFVNMANPTGVKYYAYKYDRYKNRGWMFAKGDLAISNVEILN